MENNKAVAKEASLFKGRGRGGSAKELTGALSTAMVT